MTDDAIDKKQPAPNASAAPETAPQANPDSASEPAFTADECAALSVLAFLYYRLGWTERALRTYRALGAAAPEGPEGLDARRTAFAGQAACALELGDAKGALRFAKDAFAAGALSTRAAALHLLRAQALWHEGRAEEARAALDEYLRLGGAPAQTTLGALTGDSPAARPAQHRQEHNA